MNNAINKSVNIFLFVFFAIAINVNCMQQEKSNKIFIAFWNLENLFDTIDDPGKRDEEFTPSGSGGWTNERLELKLNNLAKVISSMNEGEGPDILGVAEVEHESLLKDLIKKIKSNKKYKIAYAESPDERGIDNGLIFNSEKFSLLSILPHEIKKIGFKTRYILELTLFVNKSNDTLSIFVNHWPSRRSGEEASESKRFEAAKVLRKIMDSDFKVSSTNKIIVMGDFNDDPTNEAILNVLKAQPLICDSNETGFHQTKKEMFNLAYDDYSKGLGSYKYKTEWNMLDQIMISNNLLENDLKYICGSFQIYKPEFLVEQTGKYKGTPFPTYGGRKYLGGFSDHFPVTSIFEIRNK